VDFIEGAGHRSSMVADIVKHKQIHIGRTV
jgi:hypothetical protein